MENQRFYHHVVEQFISFMTRSAKNICVDESFNDVITLATNAATAAYHFHEVLCNEADPKADLRMSDARAEDLRQHLRDIVDTSKHGVLHMPERQTTLRSALAFEFNDQNQFRYLRTIVFAENERFGEFDVAKSIVEYMPHLGKAHNVTGLELIMKMPKRDFQKEAEIFVSDKTVYSPKNLCVQTYKRNDDDELILTDPPMEFTITLREMPYAETPFKFTVNREP